MKVRCFKADLDIFYEMYTTNCSSLLANKNMGLLKNDQSAKSIELGKQVDNEKQLDKLISQAWSESKSKSNPELLQKGILKAYMKVLNTDLTADPEYSPSLIQNISDSALGQSSQLQPSTSLAPQPGRPSFPTPPQQSSQRPSFNDLPALDNPPTRPPPRQAMMHSGQSADHSQDDPSLQLPSDLKPFTPPRPIPQSNPQPVNIKPPTPAVIDEGLGRNGGATKPNYAKLPGLDGVQSWGASPPNETIPRFGPPAGNSSLNKPPPPTQDNYVVQKAPQSQMTNSNWLKPEPPKPAVEKPAVKEKAPVESWEYKPDLTYSQMIKQAPSESTLFNTPGMYESERQKMRDQLMRNRQREFEDQLQTIRNQGDQEYNTPMHPLDFRATPSQLWTNQPTVNTYHSINDDYLNTLQERVFQSNSEFRKEQLEYQMLTNGVNSYQKATEYFEKETVKLSAKASDLTAEAEKLGADISLLKHSKEDLLQKIERKRAELLEQKRRANATSDGDHDRKRDMLDEMASLRRLAVYKTSEMSRVKAKYDELEREYHNHSLAKTKAMETPMKVLDRSLTASAMNDWAPWRNRFEEKTGEKSRRTHADMGTSLTQGESASFLADLNRSVDNLINNNSEFSSRKYRNL
jgi:hypothetical protein